MDLTLMFQAAEVDSPLHVLTLTPFFPSDKNEVSGCFIAEPIEQLRAVRRRVQRDRRIPDSPSSKTAESSAAAEWVRYLQVPGNLGLSSAGKLLYTRVLPRVQKMLRVKPIDVIHAHAALPCGHAAALLSRRLNIPFVVTVHGLDVFNTCFLGGIPAAWRRKVSVEVYRAARTVICISGKVQEILKTGMPAETSSAIVYNGVNPIFFHRCRLRRESSIRRFWSSATCCAAKATNWCCERSQISSFLSPSSMPHHRRRAGTRPV